jgi:hypothetical protein
MTEKSDNTMSESELQELRRRIGAPDNWVPGQQFQQQQQQQMQQQQITDEWEAQKAERPRRENERNDAE